MNTHPDPSDLELLPVRQVANYLGISLRTLERLVDAGKLPRWIMFANKRMYPKPVVLRILNIASKG